MYIPASLIIGVLIGYATINTLGFFGFTWFIRNTAVLVPLVALVCYYAVMLKVCANLRNMRVLAVIVLFPITLIGHSLLQTIFHTNTNPDVFIAAALTLYILMLGLLEMILRLYSPLPDHIKPSN